MPVIFTSVNHWRWPACLRECLRRRNLTIFTLSPRPCCTTSAVTLPPSTRGAPTAISSPLATRRTLSNSTVAPVSTSNFSKRRVWPSLTRCCYHQIGKQRTYFTPLFPHSLFMRVCAKLIINRAQILQKRCSYDKPYFEKIGEKLIAKEKCGNHAL